MALIKKPTFEQEPTAQAQGDTAVEERVAKAVAPEAVAEAPAAPAAAPTLEAQVVAEVAITKAAVSSVAIADAAKRFRKEVEEMKGASDFSFGNFSVFKGGNGEIACTETGDSFGRWVKVRLMSWDDHHEISPGESGASTKSFVAYSKDGKTIDSIIGEEMKEWVGQSVADYIHYLRTEEEFAKTKVRRFIDTACYVLASDSGDGPIGKTVQITLSESSIPAFARYQQELANDARAAAMGLPGAHMQEEPFQFFFLREVAQKNDNKWTKLRIVQTLPAKI